MPTAHNFFTAPEQQLLVDAIAKAEQYTSGEIRLHIENFCFGSELKAAVKVFKKLNMHQTRERNGILIYLAVVSRKVAIIGDEGIHQKLGQEFWEKIAGKLISEFKTSKKAEALAAAIVECGEQLSNYFPIQEDDRNELSNSISF